MISRFHKRIEDLRVEVRALRIALGDDRVPPHAKAIILLVVGYALSPADLLPDVIPLVGQLDDAVIVPIGMTLAWMLVPGDLRREIRDRAEREVAEAGRPDAGLLGVLAGLIMAAAYAVMALLADRV